MELVIPDGAQVHITVGHAPHLLALADESVRSLTTPAPSSKGRLLKSAWPPSCSSGRFRRVVWSVVPLSPYLVLRPHRSVFRRQRTLHRRARP